MRCCVLTNDALIDCVDVRRYGLGNTVLGRVIEVVWEKKTGSFLRFSEIMKQLLFDPCGMDEAAFFLADGDARVGRIPTLYGAPKLGACCCYHHCCNYYHYHGYYWCVFPCRRNLLTMLNTTLLEMSFVAAQRMAAHLCCRRLSACRRLTGHPRYSITQRTRTVRASTTLGTPVCAHSQSALRWKRRNATFETAAGHRDDHASVRLREVL